MEVSLQATTGDILTTKQVFLPQETLDHPFDVTLVIQDGKEFKAHRGVLSEASPFFERLLKTDMKESIEGVICLEMINEQCLRDILEFIYTGTVQISAKEIYARDLVAMADYLVLPNLKAFAGKRLLTYLTVSNSLSIYHFGVRYRCEELISNTKNFIHTNFIHVAKTDEFLSLSSEEVKMWISSDEVDVSTEEDVFKVILDWINHDKTERKKYFSALFCEVRLVYISRDFLCNYIMTSEQVIGSDECMKLVKDSLKCIESEQFQQCKIHPRKSLEAPVMVMCIQGFSRQEDNMVCCYYPREDTWSKIHGMLPVNTGEIVSCHGRLYLHLYPDNEEEGVRERSLLCYDSLSNCWSSLPYEDHRTVYNIFARNEEEIFAFVAEDVISCPECTSLYLRKIPAPCGKSPHLSFLRKYKPESNSWEDITSFDLDCNSRSGVCVVAKDNFVYLIGGGYCSPDRHEILATADRYVLSKGTWEKVANLQLPRWYARATATCSNIFVVGGVSGNSIADSCEVYNEETNEWHFIARLRKTPFDHYNPTLLGVDDQLFSLIRCICAWNRKDRIDCYDPEKKEWKEKTQIPFEQLLSRGLQRESYISITSCCSMRVFKRHNFLQQASFQDIKAGKKKCAIM